MDAVRATLFTTTAIAAIAVGAYLSGAFDRFFEPSGTLSSVESPVEGERPLVDTSQTSNEPGASGEGEGSTETGSKATDPEAADDATAGDVASQPRDARSEAVPPRFDLVRVEPDGSTVFAGIAPAGSTVEIIAGSTIIGSAVAGPTGDFAAVLDEMLAPGDYQIVLRATGSDEVVAMSAETAIVSVPDSPEGEVLALVETPGEASRLITAPQPASETVGDAPPEVAEAPGDDDRPAAAGEDGRAETDETAASDAPEADDAGDTMASAAPSGNNKAGNIGSDNGTEVPRPRTSKSAEAAGSEKTDETANEKTNGVSGSGDAPRDGVDRQDDSRQAALTGGAAEQAARTPHVSRPTEGRSAVDQVAIQAVEIEGRNIFVAGGAEAGRVVRVYANEILLGQARASEAGRFLIEAERDMPVGDYIVRADMLADDQATVLARAAVPFQREEGEFVAAVAPAVPAAPNGETGQTSASDGVKAKRAAPADAVQGGSKTEGRPVGKTDAADADAPRQHESPNRTPSSMLTPPPQGSVLIQPSQADEGTRPRVSTSRPPASDEEQPQSGSRDEELVANRPVAAEARAGEVLAPRLEPVKSAVIIRRGDSLWRISRRVYGRGVRYSTIYLANQDQISDPDRIWPGQVFNVPDQTDEGERADMSTIGDQATTATESLQ